MNNYVKNLLIENLENYEDEVIRIPDLALKVLEGYNIDGSITYNTYEAEKWLKDNYDDVAKAICEFDFTFDPELAQKLALEVFTKPERAMTKICLFVADNLVTSLDYVNKNWDKEVRLTKEVIEIIKKELEKESD